MGWTSEVPSHEGWVANVLADGRATSATDANGVIVFAADGTEERLPWDQVVAWRVMCECGWTGPSLPAVADPDWFGWRDCPDDVADTTMRPAWEQHVAPYEAVGKLEVVSGEIAQLIRRTDELVALARAGGVSWAQIGSATGLSRQGAQQRWG